MNKAIQIDPELAAKYEDPGQFEAFDEAFKKVIQTPAKDVPPVPPHEPKPRGRPKKKAE